MDTVMTKAAMRTLRAGDLSDVSRLLTAMEPLEVVANLERLPLKRRAIVFRLLDRDKAVTVFEFLDPALQGELVTGLGEEDVLTVFAQLAPPDRAHLLDMMPAAVAARLLAGLTADERRTTSIMLGHLGGSVGQWMTPDVLSVRPEQRVAAVWELMRRLPLREEASYTVSVTDEDGTLRGMVGLRELVTADPAATVGELSRQGLSVVVGSDAEAAARQCAGAKLLGLPVVDEDGRLLGVLTLVDALRILEDAETEDIARAGGSEALRSPYLATPVGRLVRSRVVWLLVLAISAILTVQVLEIFETTLDRMVVLALFIPLLTGTGGNTGNQAATTVTRALALGDVRIGDMGAVLLREVRVGAALGVLLGTLGCVLATIAYGPAMGLVIGLTLLSVCTMAATVGGAMPLIGKALRVDPAVFSNPFISTFCDATGLVIYFLIAKAILNL